MNVLKIFRNFHSSLGLNLVLGVCHPYLGSSQLNQTDFHPPLPPPSSKLGIVYKSWLEMKTEVPRHAV